MCRRIQSNCKYIVWLVIEIMITVHCTIFTITMCFKTVIYYSMKIKLSSEMCVLR